MELTAGTGQCLPNGGAASWLAGGSAARLGLGFERCIEFGAHPSRFGLALGQGAQLGNGDIEMLCGQGRIGVTLAHQRLQMLVTGMLRQDIQGALEAGFSLGKLPERKLR